MARPQALDRGEISRVQIQPRPVGGSTRAAGGLPDSPATGHGISVVGQTTHGREVDLQVTTTAVSGQHEIRIVLPEGYDDHPAARYPVLYLFHGALAGPSSWTDAPGQAGAITDPYPMITVIPDGGLKGWFLNWQSCASICPQNWETFHLNQLVPWIDANLHTVADRSGRAVAGLSMLSHPDFPPTVPAGNAVADAGFEDAGMGAWGCTAQCGVEHGLGNAHTGSGNGWVRNNAGWNDIEQTATVAPNTNYTLTGWVRTSADNTDGYLGVRNLGGKVIGEQKFGSLSGYAKLTVHLNTGNNTTVQVDDLSLTAD